MLKLIQVIFIILLNWNNSKIYYAFDYASVVHCQNLCKSTI